MFIEIVWHCLNFVLFFSNTNQGEIILLQHELKLILYFQSELNPVLDEIKKKKQKLKTTFVKCVLDGRVPHVRLKKKNLPQLPFCQVYPPPASCFFFLCVFRGFYTLLYSCRILEVFSFQKKKKTRRTDYTQVKQNPLQSFHLIILKVFFLFKIKSENYNF